MNCPACRDETLEDLAGHLVCNACDGSFATRDELVHELEDLTGESVELAFHDDRPGARPCPRCTRTMRACRLRLVFPTTGRELEVRAPLERCDPDGVWFDAGELGLVFEAAGELTVGATLD